MTLLLLASLSAHASTHRFALVAGANHGGTGRTTLRYAVSDAEAVAQVLNELGGVAPQDTQVLREPDAAALSQGFADLRRQVQTAQDAGARTEVLVYYSGHSDTEGLLLGDARYGYEVLRAELDALPSDVRVLVLDSCSSGAMVRAKGGSAQPPFLVDEAVDVTGYAYLTSAAADELAQEADPVGGSYFTHYFVSGLRGAADSSSDGQVTLSEAYEFAYSETLARTERTVGGPQHASYDIQLQGTGELIMTDLSATSASLVLSPDLEGRLYVRDDAGELVAELFKPRGRSVELGVAPGAYALLLEQGGRLWEARVELSEGATTLSASDFVPTDAEAAVARGGDVVHVPLSVGILPALALGRRDEFAVHHVDLSLGVSKVDAVQGLQLALLGGVVDQGVTGVQASVLTAVNQGDGRGVQLGVGPTWTRGDVRGLQSSVTVAVAGDVTGAQLGTLAVAGNSRGLQGGVFTFSRSSRVQLGVINGTGQGAVQMGVVNVNRGSGGVQVGVINVGRGAAAQLGVINVNPGGYNHVYLASDLADPVRVGATYGGSRLYTVAELGLRPGSRATWALGLGWHQPVRERWYVDLEAAAGSTQSAVINPGDPNGMLVPRARGLVGWQPRGGRLAVFAGPTVHVVALGWGPDDPSYTYGAGRVMRQGDVAVGGTAGVRF